MVRSKHKQWGSLAYVQYIETDFDGIAAYEELGTDDIVCKKFFDDILPDISRSINDATKVLRIIPEKGTHDTSDVLIAHVLLCANWKSVTTDSRRRGKRNVEIP